MKKKSLDITSLITMEELKRAARLEIERLERKEAELKLAIKATAKGRLH